MGASLGTTDGPRSMVLALAVLMVTAGCLGGTSSSDDGRDAESQPGAPVEEGRLVERTLTFEADVDGPQLGGGRLDIEWSTDLGVGLVGLAIELSWEEQANAFGLESERPDGTVHTVPPPDEPGATQASGNVTDVVPGGWSFHLTAADGAVLADHVTLEATATWRLVDTDQPVVDGGTVRGPVRTERTDDGWRAEVRYRTNGSVGSQIDVTVDVTNGGIGYGQADTSAHARISAWARGDTEEQARQRVLEIDVDLSIEEGSVVATAQAPDWQDRGASADVAVPIGTLASGRLDTTNGPVTVEDARFDGVTLATTNGPIAGTAAMQGELTADTTNGAIELDLTPTASTRLTAETTNGDVQLGLRESSEIAYEIDASTTNGQLSESMEEAQLRGGDQEATLVTQDGQGRPIQVTGSAGTTNGDVGFQGR